MLTMLKVLGKRATAVNYAKRCRGLGIAILGGLIAYVFLTGLVAQWMGLEIHCGRRAGWTWHPAPFWLQDRDICRWRGCRLVGSVTR